MSKRQRSSSTSYGKPSSKARRRTSSRSEILRVVRSRSDKRQANYNGNSGVSTSGDIISLTQRMVRGDTPTNTFQGEAIDWQYIRLRNICRVSASDGADTIRTIIFQWFDSSTPTVGNILNTGNGVEPILAPYQWGNRKMRRILSDKCYTTVSTASNDERTDNIFIPGSRLQKTWFSFLSTQTLLKETFTFCKFRILL